MSDTSGLPTEDSTAALGEEEVVDDAQERIDDAEAEYGPAAPPRGASPGNPQAEEDPS